MGKKLVGNSLELRKVLFRLLQIWPFFHIVQYLRKEILKAEDEASFGLDCVLESTFKEINKVSQPINSRLSIKHQKRLGKKPPSNFLCFNLKLGLSHQAEESQTPKIQLKSPTFDCFPCRSKIFSPSRCQFYP